MEKVLARQKRCMNELRGEARIAPARMGKAGSHVRVGEGDAENKAGLEAS
jgi:hypothetical protein